MVPHGEMFSTSWSLRGRCSLHHRHSGGDVLYIMVPQEEMFSTSWSLGGRCSLHHGPLGGDVLYIMIPWGEMFSTSWSLGGDVLYIMVTQEEMFSTSWSLRGDVLYIMVTQRRCSLHHGHSEEMFSTQHIHRINNNTLGDFFTLINNHKIFIYYILIFILINRFKRLRFTGQHLC